MFILNLFSQVFITVEKIYYTWDNDHSQNKMFRRDLREYKINFTQRDDAKYPQKEVFLQLLRKYLPKADVFPEG